MHLEVSSTLQGVLSKKMRGHNSPLVDTPFADDRRRWREGRETLYSLTVFARTEGGWRED